MKRGGRDVGPSRFSPTWASKYWGAATTATLPFNFSLPAGSDYWILKLKPATVGTDNVRVDCL